MAYFLLTGATGLLGRYLLRDLTLADVPLAVLVRATRFESAAQRIETSLARWERELGHALARPVILEGDIGEPDLGLSADDVAWVSANTAGVIHSAAALTFQAESPDGEPWRSNIHGTRHMLELCRRAGIRHCHHVSTAYVCGLRRGRILETELNVGQTPGNDYEQSKLIAEQEVLSSGIFEQTTIYRPSIIVGDAQTGYTTSYHGFYTPLRLVHALLQTMTWDTFNQGDWMGQLQLRGDERKNLVPVDWVSAAMTWLITHSEHHGKTYHLTNPQAVTVRSMEQAIVDVLIECVAQDPEQGPPAVQVAELAAGFREQMKVYQTYWSDDPDFDSSQTQAALPHLPCPEISREVMKRLGRFAIESNFGWPREAPIVPPHDVGKQLAPWLSAAKNLPSANGRRRFLNIAVSGQGGGQWHLVFDKDQLVAAERGVQNGSTATCYLTSATMKRIAEGTLSLEDSISTGRLVVTGNLIRPFELGRVLRELGSTAKAT